MTRTDHLDRCDKPLVDDLTFARDCAAYGVGRQRLTCVAGHSVYEDIKISASVFTPDLPCGARRCTHCDEPLAPSDSGRLHLACRRYHPLCQHCREPLSLPLVAGKRYHAACALLVRQERNRAWWKTNGATYRRSRATA